MSVFKAYDVRALHPDPLSEDVAQSIGAATATLLLGESGGSGAVVVGHDMRLSSPSLHAALCAGIRGAGADVLDVGLVDTPFVTFAINHLEAIGGVQVTASHNPAQYNGFKISRAHGRPVGIGLGLEVIRDMVEGDATAASGGSGGVEAVDLWNAYRAHVHTYLRGAVADGSRTLRIAIDASNGMAGTMVPKVFDGAAGLDIVEINFENSTGTFVHDPNPLVAANLAQVQEAVIAEECDAGMCFDGDADRCMVVDELGAIVGCDLLTAWLAPRFLAHEDPGAAVVFDLRSSQALAEEISSCGGTPVQSRVGHVYMKQAMAEHDAPFGGELSGHFYFRDNHYADSGAMACAALASALGSCDGPLSAQIAPLRRYAQSGEINFEVEDKTAAMEALVASLPEATVDRLDGVTITSEGWWCNVRASNTEPLLRLNLEAASAADVDARVAQVAPHLGSRVDH